MSMSVQVDTEQSFRRSRGWPDASQVSQLVQQQLKEHPYRTLGIAAGVGFVLGGGLLSRATGKLVAAGLRLGMAAIVAPMATQVVEQMRGARASQSQS